MDPSYKKFNLKVKSYLSNKHSLMILSILIFSFVIRLGYLILAKDQPLWWDEAEYVSASKKLAFGVPYDLNPQRPLLFQIISAALLKIGFSEVFVKFLVVLVPSIILTLLIYIFIKNLYGEKIALAGAFFSSINWSLVFWSNRFQPDYISLCFQVLSLHFACLFWKGNSSKKVIYLIGIFAALGFQFKVSGMIVPGIIFIFSLIKDRHLVIIKKEYWQIFFWFIIGLAPQLILSTLFFANPLSIFIDSGYAQVITEERALGIESGIFVKLFTKDILFILFLMGLASSLSFLLRIKKIVKNNLFDPDLFVLVGLASVISFYLFYIRGTIEDRWVFLLIPFLYSLCGKSLSIIYSILNKNSKVIAIALVILILALSTYSHLSQADSLIKNKKATYSEIKDASLFLKENSNPEDKIFSVSLTQVTAYSEREVISYAKLPIENFTTLLLKERPKFIMVSIVEPNHPDWVIKQLKNDEGYTGIFYEYFNSSIVISPEGKAVHVDIKQEYSNDLAKFELVYPNEDQFNGVLIYKIDYKE